MEAYPSAILTVDLVVVGLRHGKLHIALSKRTADPFKGVYSLIGGYVHTNEDASLDAAATRIMASKLGGPVRHFEQMFTKASPTRDPRGWSASVVYLALVGSEQLDALEALDHVDVVAIANVANITLGFDHAELIPAAISRLVAKSCYSTIAAHLLDEEFSLTDFREVLEHLTGCSINAANFRRKVLDENVVEDAGMRGGACRPAQLYRLKKPMAIFSREVAHRIFNSKIL